jgi:hypothetical protein
MKKFVSILVVGLAVLLLLSFMPSNTVEQLTSNGNEDGYITMVPAKPPKPPQK